MAAVAAAMAVVAAAAGTEGVVSTAVAGSAEAVGSTEAASAGRDFVEDTVVMADADTVVMADADTGVGVGAMAMETADMDGAADMALGTVDWVSGWD